MPTSLCSNATGANLDIARCGLVDWWSVTILYWLTYLMLPCDFTVSCSAKLLPILLCYCVYCYIIKKYVFFCNFWIEKLFNILTSFGARVSSSTCWACLRKKILVSCVNCRIMFNCQKISNTNCDNKIIFMCYLYLILSQILFPVYLWTMSTLQ